MFTLRDGRIGGLHRSPRAHPFWLSPGLSLASALTSLTRIESLKFDCFEIEPDGLPFLPLLTQLRAFHLNSLDCVSMDQVLEHITGLTNLESFDFKMSSIEDGSLDLLPLLRHLDLDTSGGRTGPVVASSTASHLT